MRKSQLILPLVLLILTLGLSACGARASADADISSIPEDNILRLGGEISAYNTLPEIFASADYVVVCEVTSRGDSYLIDGGELTFGMPHDEIMKELIDLRTPYEIKVLESFKGDLAPDDSFTVLGLNGIIDNYAVDTVFPDLEVGGVYLLPICVASEYEAYPYLQGAARLDGYDSTHAISDNGGAAVKTLMYDPPYKEITNVSELTDAVAGLSDN